MNPKPDQQREDNPEMQGEGNYVAGRHYNDATKQFVDEGRVEEAAEQAKPQSADEERQMREAEAEGRSHAKGEDPQLKPGGDRGADSGSRQPRDRAS